LQVLGKEAWARRRPVPYENKRHEKFQAFVLWGEPWAEGRGHAEPQVLVSDAQKAAEFTAAGWEAVVEQLSGEQSPPSMQTDKPHPRATEGLELERGNESLQPIAHRT